MPHYSSLDLAGSVSATRIGRLVATLSEPINA